MLSDVRLAILTKVMFGKIGTLADVAALTGLSIGHLSKCQSAPVPGQQLVQLPMRTVIQCEAFLGDPVITGAVAYAVLAGANGEGKDLGTEACELTEASSALQREARTLRDRPSPNEIAHLTRLTAEVQAQLNDVVAKLGAMNPSAPGGSRSV